MAATDRPRFTPDTAGPPFAATAVEIPAAAAAAGDAAAAAAADGAAAAAVAAPPGTDPRSCATVNNGNDGDGGDGSAKGGGGSGGARGCGGGGARIGGTRGGAAPSGMLAAQRRINPNAAAALAAHAAAGCGASDDMVCVKESRADAGCSCHGHYYL